MLTPLEKMEGIEITTAPQTVRRAIFDSVYSRLPVYCNSLHHIVGILNTKQYLQALLVSKGKEVPLESVMVEPYYVSQDMQLHTLMEEFRRRKTHIAIVVDQEHRVIGLVTMEDLLADLIGDIVEEDVDEDSAAEGSGEVTA